jgi:hypothetical protein
MKKVKGVIYSGDCQDCGHRIKEGNSPFCEKCQGLRKVIINNDNFGGVGGGGTRFIQGNPTSGGFLEPQD